jgi:hypothetical protein
VAGVGRAEDDGGELERAGGDVDAVALGAGRSRARRAGSGVKLRAAPAGVEPREAGRAGGSLEGVEDGVGVAARCAGQPAYASAKAAAAPRATAGSSRIEGAVTTASISAV